MNNVDHITFVNSVLKVTASETLNIDHDLNNTQNESISNLLQDQINEEEKINQNNI